LVRESVIRGAFVYQQSTVVDPDVNYWLGSIPWIKSAISRNVIMNELNVHAMPSPDTGPAGAWYRMPAASLVNRALAR